MMEFVVSLRSQDNWDSSQVELHTTSHQRLECPICNYRINPTQESAFVLFPCNVRAFRNESFKVWQCPSCSTIHCLDVVNLEHYYAQYPFGHQILSFPLRLCYHNLLRKFKKQNFSKNHSLLDYGCGSGQFVEYLKQKGFINSYGYDPYAELKGFGNPTVLQQAPFDYILLQDVVEHIEDPNELFYELNKVLAPGGYIFIGTPNASRINLTKPNVSDYYNSVHPPYHLHIYTNKSIEFLGHRQGWEVVDFLDRPYHDTLWFGLNTRAWNEYQRILDGTINVIFEPIQYWKALTSYKFIFFAIFGYWLSLKTEMAIMFRKTGV